VEELPLCAFRAYTGLSCPGCGLTRAFVAIAHGRFADAWLLNPFAFPLFLLALSGLAAPLLARIGLVPSHRVIAWSMGLGAAAMVAFGALRLVQEHSSRQPVLHDPHR